MHGHMSEKGVKILSSKGRIPDLQKAIVGFCKPCVLEKQKKVSFVKSGNRRKLQRLELVHTDVYGPTSVASIGGSRYYVTFIDESNRKVWVYFLKNKSEVFNTFKKWKAIVENETNLRVKCLKSDNGEEYSSREFIEYCVENMIRMLKTVPETPQQNSVAERINRTLNERAKSMRLHAGLPKMFWEDSVTMAAYLINRGPSVPLGFRIPEEEWQGKEVSLAHLRAMAQMRWDIAFGIQRVIRLSEAEISHLIRTLYMEPRAQVGAQMRVRGPKIVGASRIVEDQMKKTLKTKHPLRREAPRLYKNGEPESYSEALSSKEFVQWKKPNYEEIVSLEKNQTWSLVRLPAGKKALQSKWVFRVKEEQDGKKRYKARLVVKGFQQKQGVDYNEIFSPVVKMNTTRLVLSIVAAENLHLEQLDVKTIFLHGNLDEDIYMTQPKGFQSTGKEENLVCKLKKSLYGLKQAPRQWYLKFDSFIQRAGYKRCAMDHCSDMAEIKKLKRQLSQEFEMKDLGPAKQILGMSIIRDRMKGTLRLSQEKYIGKVLEKFNMKDAKARSVDSVMYTMMCIRPDIAHVVGVVVLEGFSDSYYGGCLDTGKSTTGYVFTVGEVGKELVWLKNFLEELDRAQAECRLFCDNQSAIQLAKNPVFHGRTKHIKIRYHYIRELVSEGTLSLKNILGAKNPADMLTKVVTTEKLKLCAASTGLRDN
ncbi:retrovirus-related pol polyprotein from transposon TNT 1-94 [Tanacetum coccineum]|uniref:Retrovirus-related pol polyprotein from transposon TNT 1-94 n=1 Tax=Tanacetum coccineum TaxID=301880 RepID=A0ABQ5GHE3_9ASTR